VQRAQSHTLNMPRAYYGFAMQHRADYSLHWKIGIDINERQMAMAPKANELRMRLLQDLAPPDAKATAAALLAQLTDRLSLLEALHMEVMAAAAALKPITSARGFASYPKWWAAIKADPNPYEGAEPE
jgi:hypothetical protein